MRELGSMLSVRSKIKELSKILITTDNSFGLVFENFDLAETLDGNEKTNTKAKFRILLDTYLVSSLIMLDSNIVAVSLLPIGQNLHTDFAEIECVIRAYLLAYAGSLLAAGAPKSVFIKYPAVSFLTPHRLLLSIYPRINDRPLRH
jgi:hypothetical protein